MNIHSFSLHIYSRIFIQPARIIIHSRVKKIAPRVGACRRPAVLWAFPLSGPQMLVHIYIPRNRTPRGWGLGELRSY